MKSLDTIAAISTPAGKGGIAVVRISGEQAIEIADKIFLSKSKKKLSDTASHRLVFGEIYHDKQKIDEVLVSVLRAPHSFTGENTVEISCHGSEYIQEKILQILVANKVRIATAGEFTQRAFLNGKMDLAQAEAVADLISSENEAAHRVALQQLRGGFSEELNQLREQLLRFVSLMELELDFSEEDVEFVDRSQLRELLKQLRTKIDHLLQSFALGNVIKNGVPVVIVGQTNVGKSTLLNTLLGEERAIVSDIHGTTRDTIEDSIQLNGIKFCFIDTAGIRHTNETIEQLGIERTYEKIRKASVILLLLDATQPESFETSVRQVVAHISEKQYLIVLLNKCDKQDTTETKKIISNKYSQFPVITISAKQKQGIDELITQLVKTVNLSSLSNNETIVTNVRHYEALQRTQEALTRVETGFDENIPSDLIAQDIRESLYHLGTITGQISTDEILGNIFSKFCIGK